MSPSIHAATPALGGLHFEVHRSALVEAAADAAWTAAWAGLWLAFVLALSPPPTAPPAGLGAAEPSACAEPPAPSTACQVQTGASTQPDPGSSSRGVAHPDPGGAG